MASRVGRFVTLAVGVLAAPAFAAWPNDRPIELLVGFAAGGGQDVMARTMQPFLEKALNAKIVIVNRPGATGELAYTALSQAKPDGYTFSLLSLPGYVTMQVSRKVKFDSRNIAPLARLVVDPSVVVVQAASPHKGLAELVAFGKAHPRKVSLGGSGLGTDEHFTSLMLRDVAGAEVTYVPFAGAAEAFTSLLGDHITMVGTSVSGIASTGLDKSGSAGVRPIAQLSAKRHPLMPGVPTAREQGIDIVLGSERGMAIHAEVPTAIRSQFEAAIKATLEDPAFQAKAAPMKIPFEYLSGEEWARWMESRRQMYQAMWDKAPWIKN